VKKQSNYCSPSVDLANQGRNSYHCKDCQRNACSVEPKVKGGKDEDENDSNDKDEKTSH
jgi:hypothetical protein